MAYYYIVRHAFTYLMWVFTTPSPLELISQSLQSIKLFVVLIKEVLFYIFSDLPLEHTF